MLDFGLVKVRAWEQNTVSPLRVLEGTPAYLCPEQALVTSPKSAKGGETGQAPKQQQREEDTVARQVSVIDTEAGNGVDVPCIGSTLLDAIKDQSRLR
ncbi:MAG: hypothetical protein RBU37_19175 [Myxococcota bacterium]|nr:hypothetical protein [Myxococcota bacterium]